MSGKFDLDDVIRWATDELKELGVSPTFDDQRSRDTICLVAPNGSRFEVYEEIWRDGPGTRASLGFDLRRWATREFSLAE